MKFYPILLLSFSQSLYLQCNAQSPKRRLIEKANESFPSNHPSQSNPFKLSAQTHHPHPHHQTQRNYPHYPSTISSMASFCQFYVEKIDNHTFKSPNQETLEATKVFKRIIRLTLNDLIDDFEMIRKHKMNLSFNLYLDKFNVGTDELLGSIRSIVDKLDHSGELFINSVFQHEHSLDHFAQKINGWKLSMRSRYTHYNYMPVKLCYWFHKLRKQSDRIETLVQDVSFLQIIAFNQTSNTLKIGDSLNRLASLYTSITTTYKSISPHYLLSFYQERMLERLTVEYLWGAHFIESKVLTNDENEQSIMHRLKSLIGRMTLMLQKLDFNQQQITT